MCLRLRYSEDLVDHVCICRSKSAELGSPAPAPFGIAKDGRDRGCADAIGGSSLDMKSSAMLQRCSFAKPFSHQESNVGQRPHLQLI